MSRGTVLVTGGAKRIGAEISALFAKNKWNVLVVYHSSGTEADQLVKNLNQFGTSNSAIQFDLSKTAELESFLAEVLRRHPDLRVIVNNASVFEFDSAQSINVRTWDDVLKTNCLAPILLSQAFARLSDEALDRRIINILDQKIENLNPDFFSYTISKVALAGAAQMMAMQFEPQGIKVLNVAPGLTLLSGEQTLENFDAVSRLNLLERPNATSEVADAVLYLATSAVSTGQTLYVDSGQHLVTQARDVMFLPTEPIAI